jgi:hypothetical protein
VAMMGLNDFSNIDRVLEELALKDEYRFNAYQVASLSNEIDVDSVNEYLLYKTHPKFGILEAKIETICPENHPDKHFDFGEALPDGEVECRICDESYTLNPYNSHIVFYFKDKYKKEVKKKALKSSKKLLVPI